MFTRTDTLVSQQETGKIAASIAPRCGRLSPGALSETNEGALRSVRSRIRAAYEISSKQRLIKSTTMDRALVRIAQQARLGGRLLTSRLPYSKDIKAEFRTIGFR